jgi:hypothetical protein
MANKSLDKVGEEAGLGKGSIRNWRDCVPNIDAVAAVCRVLGVTLNDVYYGEEQ